MKIQVEAYGWQGGVCLIVLIAVTIGVVALNLFLHYQNLQRWKEQDKTDAVILRYICVELGLDDPSPCIDSPNYFRKKALEPKTKWPENLQTIEQDNHGTRWN